MITIHLADAPVAPAIPERSTERSTERSRRSLAEGRSTVYLPIISTPPLPPVGEPVEPEPRPGTPADEFLALLLADSRQQRPLTKCAKLEQSALWRAYGLAHGDPWLHVDKDGISANEYVRRAGCKLPDDYSVRGNQVESLVAGSADSAVMFAALASSPAHSQHLFGVGWFAHQTNVGIAMAQGGPFGFYWAIHICLCGQVSGE